MGDINLIIQVPIGPAWKNVALLRTSILNCLAAVFEDYDFCDNLGMVASELIENAIKYGDWTRRDGSSFQLNVRGSDRAVTVAVSNPVAADAAEHAIEAVRWLGRFATAGEAYEARLRAIAAEARSSESRLGLVRIAYQAACRLDARVEGSSGRPVLHVMATSQI